MFAASRYRFLSSLAGPAYQIKTSDWSRRQWYALSRFPERNTGVGRHRSRVSLKVDSERDATPDLPRVVMTNDSDSLGQLLLQSNTLVIERQIEMLNVFVGFEQSNKYTISTQDNEEGEILGYVAEDSKGILGTLSRQIFATHRSFQAVIMDKDGKPVLSLRRPFAWINSRMFVQRIKEHLQYDVNAEPSLETVGEVQQIWHPWRRKYDLFLREPGLISSEIKMKSGFQVTEAVYRQAAQVDSGFLAWHFRLLDASKNEIASIDRTFRGLSREIFTDTGRYSVYFTPRELVQDPSLTNVPNDQHISSVREARLNERALFLALAVEGYFTFQDGIDLFTSDMEWSIGTAVVANGPTLSISP